MSKLVKIGTVILSVPLIETASITVITAANTKLFICHNSTELLTKNIEIIIKEIRNIVRDPATDFLDSPILNFLLGTVCPITAANPSPYPITKIPIIPMYGFLMIPKE